MSSGKFVVETSGGHQQLPGFINELQIVFHSTPDSPISVNDLPAHWYEAQLRHYGLKPSKVKGTATMRLLDELNKRTLRAPKNILKPVLVKEWYGDESNKDSSSEPSKGKLSPPNESLKQLDKPNNNLNFYYSSMSLKAKGK